MKFFLFIVFVLGISCNREGIVVTEEELSTDIMYIKDTYKPFSGKCKVLYNNSKVVKEQFTFKNGILEGESIAWYKNGNLRRKGRYTNGHISGKWIFWDEQGHKTVEANYLLDSLNGTYISLHSNGKIKEKGHFTGNKQTGKWVYYDERGQLMYSSVK